MYTFNTYDNKLYKTIGNDKIEVIQDINNVEMVAYIKWQKKNGNPPIFHEIDIESVKSKMLIELTEKCEYLTDIALISAINKEGSVTFLRGQAERYRNKYNVANQYCIDQSINNKSWYDAIVLEMNNTNIELGYDLTIPIFMKIIKEAFEIGLKRSETFEPNIEIYRCKTKDFIISGQIDRAREMLDFVLPNNFDLVDIDNFLQIIDEI